MTHMPIRTRRLATVSPSAPRLVLRFAIAPVFVALVSASAPVVHAAQPALPQIAMRAPAALAYETAVNIGVISALLSKNHQQVMAMIAERSDAIVAREREAAQAQGRVENEVDMYRMSRGAALADSLRALMRTGDRAALDSSGLDTMAAALRAEVAAGTVLPQISNEKLDAAAKELAVLAEEPSPLERAREVIGFIKATKQAVDKLEDDAALDKQKADDAIKTATNSTIKGQTP